MAAFAFFALDSNYVDEKQLDWLDKELAASGSDWKIVFLPSSALLVRRDAMDPAELQREKLEPLFVKHGVNVVLTGHEHFYERIKPQKGIAYFIVGNSSRSCVAVIFRKTGSDSQGPGSRIRVHRDGGRAGDDPVVPGYFRKGETIDTGSVHRVGKTTPTPGRSAQPVQPVRRQSQTLAVLERYPARPFDPMRYKTWWRNGSAWLRSSKSSAGLWVIPIRSITRRATVCSA